MFLIIQIIVWNCHSSHCCIYLLSLYFVLNRHYLVELDVACTMFQAHKTKHCLKVEFPKFWDIYFYRFAFVSLFVLYLMFIIYYTTFCSISCLTICWKFIFFVWFNEFIWCCIIYVTKPTLLIFLAQTLILVWTVRLQSPSRITIFFVSQFSFVNKLQCFKYHVSCTDGKISIESKLWIAFIFSFRRRPIE